MGDSERLDRTEPQDTAALTPQLNNLAWGRDRRDGLLLTVAMWLQAALERRWKPRCRGEALRSAATSSHEGTSALLARLTGEGRAAGTAALLTTFVTAQPVALTGGEAGLSAR